MAEKTERGGDVWSAEEKAAMKEHAAEQKAARSRTGTKEQKAAADAQALLEKIAELPDADRAIAERVHELITSTAPQLAPKTWYGMPAYYRDGKVLCFFQAASKFKARYATLGFDESAALDDGDMWATSFALAKLTPAVERRIVGLVQQAIG
ncbi:iron chaperone [Protaetiibacter intestinalis]|uniref:DUF1801 domain-containing protein n=1 Tax=Protaetiibacter intestinalis TaxID=2419774 RepID=A0A387BJI1_9MICO|nr:DUF1801 domain-containing protein [Protaetiibacter intestinalis]AYF98680.1 DUF1801 domain-containing protein [Protaetiibacter intestinalis]